VYVGSGHNLYAIKEGKEVWRSETGFCTADPLVGPDGTVYAGNNKGQVYAVKDGKEIWKFETGREVKSSPCLGSDGTVYAGNREGTLYAIKDGTLAGNFKTNGYIDYSPCIGADGTIYVEGGRSFHALKNPRQNVVDTLSESTAKEESEQSGIGLVIEDDFLIADGCKLRINK